MNTIEVMICDDRIKEDEIAYQTDYAAGIDLYALPTTGGMEVGYGTGIRVRIPEGYVGIVCPRSSMGKRGYALKNTIGVIDSDYRGEVRLLLNKPITEKTRIAQLLIMPCPQFNINIFKGSEYEDDEELGRNKVLPKTWRDTARGEGGFGSTGTD